MLTRQGAVFRRCRCHRRPAFLPISWMCITPGGCGRAEAGEPERVLNANLARDTKDACPVLYTGRDGRVAHECILDIRPLKRRDRRVPELDIAKRLIDFGFHASTMSFPVAGTLMVEPTESGKQGRAGSALSARCWRSRKSTTENAARGARSARAVERAAHQGELVGECAEPSATVSWRYSRQGCTTSTGRR